MCVRPMWRSLAICSMNVQLLRMSTLTSDARARVRISALCAGALATTILLAEFFRTAMERLFNGHWRESLHARAIAVALFAAACALVWFLFVFLCLAFDALRPRSIPTASDPPKENFRSNARSLIRIMPYVATAAFVLAITAVVVLEANDRLFFSRLLPWIPSLIWLQDPGFRVASRLFPCQFEGFDTGCEAYKRLPAFVLSNAIAYFAFLLVGTLPYCRSAYIRSAWPSIWRSLIRYGTVIGSFGLCVRLFIHGIAPGLELPIHAFDVERLGWIVLNNATGIVALLLFLFVPFCGYKALLALRSGMQARSDVIDLTWLASFVVIAILLGNQFLN
jgi:hypothetical protein